MSGVAKQVGAIVKGFASDDPATIAQLLRSLKEYARLITPWAAAVGKYMLADVNVRNERAWRQHGVDLGRALRDEIRHTPTGALFRGLLAEQVTLIQSLPLEAAERVHEIVQGEMPRGTRSTTIAKQILASSDIPKWRAKMIARTEVSRAAVMLTQARAQAIGSTGYIWRTVGDSDVRESHKKLSGKFIRWDRPPKTDKSLDPYHAGCGPNCRCYAEPVLPDF